jgi:hypothetical protein
LKSIAADSSRPAFRGCRKSGETTHQTFVDAVFRLSDELCNRLTRCASVPNLRPGGQGSILNILLGGLIIRIIAAAVSLAGVPASVESVLVGGILLAMLLLDYAVNWRSGKSPAAHWRLFARSSNA